MKIYRFAVLFFLLVPAVYSCNKKKEKAAVTEVGESLENGIENGGVPASSTESTETEGIDQTSFSSTEELLAQASLLYAEHCMTCHNTLEATDKKGRDAEQIRSAIELIDQMNHLSFLSEIRVGDMDVIDAIASALRVDEQAPQLEQSEDGRLQFTCEENTYGKNPMAKLTNREFKNTVSAILDTFDANLKEDTDLQGLLALMPSDVVTVQGERDHEQSFLISSQMVDSHLGIAFRAAEILSGSQNSLQEFMQGDACLQAAELSQTCLQGFIEAFASLAFRRPVTNEQVERILSQAWESSLDDTQKFLKATTTILMAPEFLYLAYDKGQFLGSSVDTLEMDAYSLSSKVAYFLTGFPPDEELMNLATNGELLRNEILSAQVDRLLALPIAKDRISRFFREAYGYDHFSDFSYSVDFLAGVNSNGLQNAMVSELDEFFYSEVIESNASLADLFTSRQSRFNHQGLASIYGVSSNDNPVELNARRSGFLNRAAFLAKRSVINTSPIKRGQKVLETVLCETIGVPPADAPTDLSKSAEGALSIRQATEMTSQAEGSSCALCHNRFNPLGYAFEHFDSLGRFRDMERLFNDAGDFVSDAAVNTADSSDEVHPGQAVLFQNSAELTSELANSDRAATCLVKHLKEFESRRAVSQSDSCQMNSILDVIYGAEDGQPGSIKEALKTFVTSEQFRIWSF
ncbi:MAG: DUF1588 domain-containing protein [Oligoflexales bacterium]